MNWRHLVLILTVLFLYCSPAAGAEPYKVVFETMDCNGSTGFATLSPDEIYKVEDGDCVDPERCQTIAVGNASSTRGRDDHALDWRRSEPA